MPSVPRRSFTSWPGREGSTSGIPGPGTWEAETCGRRRAIGPEPRVSRWTWPKAWVRSWSSAPSEWAWPVTLRFQGGRGNITAAGSLMALAPAIGALAWVPVLILTARKLLAVFGRRAHIVGTTSRITPIASLAGFASYAVIGVASGNMAAAAAGTVVTTLVLLRRVTAPWPPDPATGRPPERSFISLLVFDRPTVSAESGDAGQESDTEHK